MTTIIRKIVIYLLSFFFKLLKFYCLKICGRLCFRLSSRWPLKSWCSVTPQLLCCLSLKFEIHSYNCFAGLGQMTFCKHSLDKIESPNKKIKINCRLIFVVVFVFSGNKLECHCDIAWIWGLRNETKNVKLRQELDKLTCFLETSNDVKLDEEAERQRALEIARNPGKKSKKTRKLKLCIYGMTRKVLHLLNI